VIFSLLLQAAVLYVPPLRRAFSTTALDARDWALCGAVASSMLWLTEVVKLVRRVMRAARGPANTKDRGELI
jgi:Ca2+-transporting ATPase